MTDNYEIVRYVPALKAQLLELQTVLWSSSLELNAAYFHWKYEANPYLDEPIVYLAMHRGVVVGMRGFFGFTLESGEPGRACRQLYADDMAVAPSHRGCGLMAGIMQFALADLAARGHQYLFNLSAGAITLHSSLQMGWHSAGWMRPMRCKPLQARLRRRVRRLVGQWHWPTHASGGPSWFGLAPPTLEALDASQGRGAVRRFPQVSISAAPRYVEMASLAERLAIPGTLRHVRDAAYFRWRFANPLSRYRFVYWDEGGLAGYLVLQEYTSDRADREVVNIVDWEAGTPAIQAALLEVATRLARARILALWSAGLSQTTVELLRSHGFRTDPEPSNKSAVPSLIMRPLQAALATDAFNILGLNALDLSNWNLRMLFSMLG